VISIPAFANDLNKYKIVMDIEMQDTYVVGCSLYIEQAYKSAPLLQNILVLHLINYEPGLKYGEKKEVPCHSYRLMAVPKPVINR
jgi:hypothetical protein